MILGLYAVLCLYEASQIIAALRTSHIAPLAHDAHNDVESRNVAPQGLTGVSRETYVGAKMGENVRGQDEIGAKEEQVYEK